MINELSRFIVAQDTHYATAYREISNGKKTSHWMWFIFPQLKGLGVSELSKRFGINGIREANRYLSNDFLANNLFNITQVLLLHKGKNIVDIFGDIDAMKLQSCMTLFDIIMPNAIFSRVLKEFYNGEKCKKTIELLNNWIYEDENF